MQWVVVVEQEEDYHIAIDSPSFPHWQGYIWQKDSKKLYLKPARRACLARMRVVFINGVVIEASPGWCTAAQFGIPGAIFQVVRTMNNSNNYRENKIKSYAFIIW